jgi:exopolysaccharide biosynthesis polyprenyl glycosylphosphotransferase
VKSVIARWGPRLGAHVHVAFDLVAVMLAAVIAARISGEPIRPSILACAACLALVWSMETFVVRYYDPWAIRSGVEVTALVSLLVVGCATALGALRLVFEQDALPGVGEFFVVLWPFVIAPRMLLFRRLDVREPPIQDVLVLGTGPMARCTAEELRDRPRTAAKVIGHLRFADEPEVSRVLDADVLGTSADLEHALRATPIDEVYIAGHPARHFAEMQTAIRICERFGIPFALPAYSFRLERARPAEATSVSDGFLHFVTHAPRPYQRSIKRLFDIFASAAALLLLSPLLAAVAIAVKLTSKGPIFFKQARVGLHGRPFNMFKFRTMIAGADRLKEDLAQKNEQTGPVFKMKNDPRVTPIGRILRKHSVDELPQLINVLRGDMSIVGPRPPIAKEVALYEGWQRRRLSVRPGLTCIWQVSGRNQISFEEWMFLDMQYIDHWSLREDLSLILQTVPVVFTGRGAS